ncbi:MAG: hypothetical protein AAF585_13370 [Verrucomicrobiota bacterium]
MNPTQSAIESTSKSNALQAAEELRAAAGAKAQQLKDAAESRAKQIREAAEERADQFKDVAEKGADQLKDVAGPAFEEAIDRAKEVQVELEEYVRANPTKAILTTFGIGIFIGMILRR